MVANSPGPLPWHLRRDNNRQSRRNIVLILRRQFARREYLLQSDPLRGDEPPNKLTNTIPIGAVAFPSIGPPIRMPRAGTWSSWEE